MPAFAGYDGVPLKWAEAFAVVCREIDQLEAESPSDGFLRARIERMQMWEQHSFEEYLCDFADMGYPGLVRLMVARGASPEGGTQTRVPVILATKRAIVAEAVAAADQDL